MTRGSPWRSAHAAASVRLAHAVFWRIERTWFAAVCRLMCSRAPISRLLHPLATSRTTATSRSVSPTRPRVSCRRAPCRPLRRRSWGCRSARPWRVRCGAASPPRRGPPRRHDGRGTGHMTVGCGRARPACRRRRRAAGPRRNGSLRHAPTRAGRPAPRGSGRRSRARRGGTRPARRGHASRRARRRSRRAAVASPNRAARVSEVRQRPWQQRVSRHGGEAVGGRALGARRQLRRGGRARRRSRASAGRHATATGPDRATVSIIGRASSSRPCSRRMLNICTPYPPDGAPVRLRVSSSASPASRSASAKRPSPIARSACDWWSSAPEQRLAVSEASSRWRCDVTRAATRSPAVISP